MEAWTEFVTARFPRWLGVLDKQAPDAGFMFGDAISYADLAVCNVCRMFGDALGLREYMERHAPKLMRLSDVVAKRDNVVKLWKEQAETYGDV